MPQVTYPAICFSSKGIFEILFLDKTPVMINPVTKTKARIYGKYKGINNKDLRSITSFSFLALSGNCWYYQIGRFAGFIAPHAKLCEQDTQINVSFIFRMVMPEFFQTCFFRLLWHVYLLINQDLWVGRPSSPITHFFKKIA